MGFFGDISKALLGQPVTKTDETETNRSQEPTNRLVDERGRKIIPEIEIRNIKSVLQGDTLLVSGVVFNQSTQQLQMISCTMFRQERRYNHIIDPKKSYMLTLYQGPAPMNENDSQARFVYKQRVNDDVFQNHYHINFDLQDNNKRTVADLNQIGQVHDI